MATEFTDTDRLRIFDHRSMARWVAFLEKRITKLEQEREDAPMEDPRGTRVWPEPNITMPVPLHMQDTGQPPGAKWSDGRTTLFTVARGDELRRLLHWARNEPQIASFTWPGKLLTDYIQYRLKELGQ